MTALVFLGALVAIFFAVLIIEVDREGHLKLQRPVGLITWLTRGNWPAKIGGALIIVGLGALLRFALINIDVAPQLKLAAGIVIAFALGLGSMLVPGGGAKRPVSLALGGAAFGVAYLTAYSAFGFFEYLSNPMGLALLGLTSVAAGVFAITRSALSLALLSMLGAFLAPAFAVSDPGPVVVYGYYVGASLLTLVMVAMRGWRPLIHLSFLFSLVGGVFFGWTAQYYTDPHAAVMLPMLLLLAALHVAMPIVEKGQSHTPWIERLDLVYMLTLPTVAALLAVIISPDQSARSAELICLAAIWALAAAGLRFVAREGVAVHAVIAGLLMLLGVAARFKNLPWELISLALGVAGLAIAAWRRKPVSGLHSILAGLVLLFGALHVLYSIAAPTQEPAFLNGTFVERIIGATLLIIAGAVCRKIRQPLDTLLLAVGIAWAVLAMGIELVHWELATFALVVHWGLLLLAASLWIPGRRVRIADANVIPLVIAIIATAAWSSTGALSATAVLISVFAAPLVLIGIAARPMMAERDSRDQRFGAVLMALAAAAIWAFKAAALSGIGHWQFAFAIVTVFAIAALIVGSMVERGGWLESATDVFGVGFAALLAMATLLNIARTPWAIVLELLCLALLVVVALIRRSQRRATDLSMAACMVGLALILQANIMRWLGPAGDLDIGDVLRLKWPAVISLLWAMVGSVLTIWSQKAASRTLWGAGATLLVAAAIKLLFIDFGALGQLANILAVIAAGVVFLLVGWLAPMPPAVTQDREAIPTVPTAHSERGNVEANCDAGHKKSSWTLAIVVMTVVVLFQFRESARGFTREALSRPANVHGEALSNQPGQGIRLPAPVVEPTDPQPSVTADETGEAIGAADVVDVPAHAASARHDVPVSMSASPDTSVTQNSDSPPEPDEKPWKVTVDANGVRSYTQTTPSMRPSDASTTTPAFEEQGLDQLLRESRIRRATPRDVDAWVAATGRKDRSALHLNLTDPAAGDQYIFRTYVVLRKMTFPDGLYGAHSATFIVPRNVPRPYGNPGHSRVLETP